MFFRIILLSQEDITKRVWKSSLVLCMNGWRLIDLTGSGENIELHVSHITLKSSCTWCVPYNGIRCLYEGQDSTGCAYLIMAFDVYTRVKTPLDMHTL